MTIQSATIRIHQISEKEEFLNLKDAWGNLFAQNYIQSAFLSWEWLYSWWEVYEDEQKLWIITAWNADELVGIVPLMYASEKRRGFSFNTLYPLGSPLCDVSGILLKDESEAVLRAMSDYLIQQKGDWDTLVFNNFRQDDFALVWIKSYLHDAGMKIREKSSDHFYIPLTGNWDEYLASLPRGFRKNIRRATRGSARKGEVSCLHFLGKNATWQVFQKIIKIDRYSKYPIIYQSDKEQAFHKLLFSYTPAKNKIELFFLEIDNIPVAYEYGFVQNGRYESWRASYDYRFDPKISIGTLLSKLVTEKSFELGYKEIDFLRGAESYKRNWKPAVRKYSKIRFIRKRNFLAIGIYIWFPQFKNRLASIRKKLK